MERDTLVFDGAEREQASEGLDAYLREQVAEANRQDLVAWAGVRSLAHWETFRSPRIEALERSLGTYPDPPETIASSVVGEIRANGYAIENVLFSSRDDITVTANVHRPEAEPNRVGIVFVHSHHNPRTQPELQDMGAMWARAGCTVLAMDQFAYGERREHRVGSRHDYWNRYNTGVQLQLIGDSLMGWMVYDLRRGIDLLQQRYRVDRIVMIGSVAGGGDPCAVTAALDERVDVAVPFNFGGPQPETPFPFPGDAETSFNYLGTGGWETTRNLAWSGRDRFLPWVIAGAIAPRRLIYAHEFSWDRERDPVWKRLERIYEWYDAEDRLDFTQGFGLLSGRPPHASHCNNVGPAHRERIHAALQRWLDVAVPEDREDRRDERQLFCYPGGSRTPGRKDAKMTDGDRAAARPARIWGEQDRAPYLTVLARIAADRRKESAAASEGMADDERRNRLRLDWQSLLGDVSPDSGYEVFEQRRAEDTAIAIEWMGLRMSDGVLVPVVVLTSASPASERDVRAAVTLMVSADGKEKVASDRWDEIEERLRDGAVCLVDVRGVGEAGPDEPRTFRSRCAGRAATALMLGETILGMQLRDIRTVVAHLRSAGYTRVAVEGCVEGAGRSEANEVERGRDDPDDSDVVAREYVEPMGALLAHLIGLFEDDVTVHVAGDPFGAMSKLLEKHVVDWPYDAIVPGALTLMMED